MKQIIVSILKPVAEFCFELVNKVTPNMALMIYVALMLLLGLWITTLKQEGICHDTGARYGYCRDMRTGAVIIIAIQIVIYLIFR